MTEAELLAHTADSYANSQACIAMCVTMLSGYLIIAYVAGENMSRPQVVLVNLLYLMIASAVIYAGFSFLLVAQDSGEIAWKMTTQRTQPPGRYAGQLIIILLCTSVLASLKFMWDVRHPKTE